MCPTTVQMITVIQSKRGRSCHIAKPLSAISEISHTVVRGCSKTGLLSRVMSNWHSL